MKILVTGGLGFVGSNLTQSLIAKKHNVIVLTKSFSKISNVNGFKNKIKIKKCDITNKSDIEKIIRQIKPDVIVHLAGQTSHAKSFENPILDLDLNSKSTLLILEALRKFNLKCRFVLGSTFIVIGKPSKLPVNEESVCNPTTIYGTNRLSSEYYCKIYHNLFGIDTVVFRITNAYGPKEQYLTTKNAVNFMIYNAFKEKNVTIFNEGKFFRDFIYISDVVSGIETVIKKGKKGNLYWISSFKKTWFSQFGKLLESHTSGKIIYKKTPRYTKKVDVGNFIVNNSKLCSLGWKPKISLSDGIERTILYFKENNL